MGWINHNDADLQTPEPQAGEQAWVPGAHEDEGWSQGVEPSSEAGSDPSGGHDRPEVAAVSPERKERLPRSTRIRHSTEIRALLERGKRKRTTNLDVFFTPSPASRSRLGLIVPNIVSRLIGDNMRRAVPLVALLGAALVLLCDIIGRVVRFPFEIPISIVMGMVGGVVFLWLLLSTARPVDGVAPRRRRRPQEQSLRAEGTR